MGKKWSLWMILPVILFSCNRDNQREQEKNKFSKDIAECNYNIDVTEMRWSTHADSIFLKLLVMH